MAAGLIYRITGTNVEGKFIKVDILDNSIQTDGTPQVIELEGSGSPIVISSIDNSEGKFTAIRPQQARIQFISVPYGVETFSSGADDRFKVNVQYDTSLIFEGYLSLDDNKELFLDGRNIVELTANDKLAALKDVELFDFAGDTPRGKYTLAQLVAMCLKQTGLNNELRIVNTLIHGTGSRTVTNITFAAADNSITFDFNASFFYPGMVLVITDSVSNNITTRVETIESSTKITVADALVDETAIIYNVTFSDYSSTKHFFEAYLDSLTFEGDINTLIDPYTILSRILGNMHELFYMDFHWWIVRKSEKYKTSLSVASFTEEGEYLETNIESYPKSFGIDETHWFAEERTEVHPTRPFGKLILTANYRYPVELICNNAFERGVVSDPPDMALAESEGKYVPECWELARLEAQPIDATFYIAKLFMYGYLSDSSLVITPATSTNTPFTFAKPVSGMPITVGDKVTFNFAYRFRSNFGAGEGAVTYFPARVWGIDEEGKVWHWWNTDTPLDPATFFWQDPDIWNTDPFTQYERLYPDAVNLDQADESNNKSISIALSAAPVNLEIYIGFNHQHQNNDAGDNQEALFSSLNIDYSPLTNGSYQKFTGEKHIITQPVEGYKSKYEKEAFIFDAIKPVYKGAIFTEYSGVYSLTRKWYEPDLDLISRPLLWWCAFDIWNQYRNSPTVLEFVAAGVGASWPHMIHAITVTDADPLTVGRLFEIITFEKDLALCMITGNMPELYRDGYNYDDPYDYKYVTQ